MECPAISTPAPSSSLLARLRGEAKTITIFVLNNNNNLLHARLVQSYSVSDLTLTGLPLLEIKGEPMKNSLLPESRAYPEFV